MSARQAKKNRIIRRKMAELAWLSENIGQFVEGAMAGIYDWGVTLVVAINKNGERKSVVTNYSCLTKRMNKEQLGDEIARELGAA